MQNIGAVCNFGEAQQWELLEPVEGKVPPSTGKTINMPSTRAFPGRPRCAVGAAQQWELLEPVEGKVPPSTGKTITMPSMRAFPGRRTLCCRCSAAVGAARASSRQDGQHLQCNNGAQVVRLL